MVMGVGGMRIREYTPRGVPSAQPKHSHLIAFQSTCFQTKGKCKKLARISQRKIRDVESSGGRKNVSATTRVREKPKPQIPRKIPPKITASPIKIYKKGDNSSIKTPDSIFLFSVHFSLAKKKILVYAFPASR